MFAAAVDDGLIPVNPVSRVGKFVGNRENTPTERLDPFTVDELRHLLATCWEHFPTEYPFVLTWPGQVCASARRRPSRGKTWTVCGA